MDAVIRLIELSGAGAAVADSRLQAELRTAKQQAGSRAECRQAVQQYRAMSEAARARMHSDNIARLNRSEAAHLESVRRLREAATGMRAAYEAWRKQAEAAAAAAESVKTAETGAKMLRARSRSQVDLTRAARPSQQSSNQ